MTIKYTKEQLNKFDKDLLIELFLFGCFQFQVIRFRCIQVADCLCFIKEYDSPVYFHETY